uniref:GIY-YIG domain-containing protein n=1 Tax=Tremella fuciformis TaxID=64657 RepID=A0A2H4QC70_9TREE|nr:hypothetical protein [Tremella fuciformis]
MTFTYVHVTLQETLWTPYSIKIMLAQAIHTFKDPQDLNSIKAVCKGRSGVYRFINNLNGNTYVGSAIDLYNRLLDYQQQAYLRDKQNLVIVRALNKYGINNFTIVILEFTNYEDVRTAEQYWIDTYKPVYNILAVAGSSLGFNHTDESKLKISESMKGKERSNRVREAMSKRQKGSANTFYAKSHTPEAKELIRARALAREVSHKPGTPVTVLDTLTEVVTTYKSQREAAKALQCSRVLLNKHNGKLLHNRYIVNFSS